MSLSQEIKHKAIELGFDLFGVTDASPINTEQAEIFAQWLKSGFAGQMAYMHRNLQKRLDPGRLFENAQSIIVVGLNYTPPKHKPELSGSAAPSGRIADYAQYEDYHSFIKGRLYQLTDFIKSLAGDDLKFKICVDSVPLAERALAVRAGLGFIGKNHMLINPGLGCRIFLGEIITDLKLPADKPVAGIIGLREKREVLRLPIAQIIITRLAVRLIRPTGLHRIAELITGALLLTPVTNIIIGE